MSRTGALAGSVLGAWRINNDVTRFLVRHIPESIWTAAVPGIPDVLTYFVAHEAHHRGQIILAARQLGMPVPPDVIAGLWRWKPRSRGKTHS